MSKELLHLFKAITEDRLEQVKVALKDHRSIVNMHDEKGNTPLIIASGYNNTDILNALIKHGAHINYQTPKKQQTPLMIAAEKGNAAAVKYLLESGANTQLKDADGKTALAYAQQHKHQEVIRLLEH